ncbi:MAG: YjbQ family protein [Candidatus Aminicenantes bacterium]|nr:YjbQ family protein [Candidatus Aminicenantes bacterium]HHF51434.1 YjbQ family protein [Candidatus Aminicenantes bacterium]
MISIKITTNQKEELLDVTPVIKDALKSSGINNGLCIVFVPHTTAGVTINENADPSVKEDMLRTLRKIVPDSLTYTHAEGNSPAHIKASLIGSSVEMLIKNRTLVLGTWQGIFFCEFDGPRQRQIYVQIFKE